MVEAAAAGTPTLAYDVPGVSDTVEEGRDGIRVRDGGVRALAEAAHPAFEARGSGPCALRKLIGLGMGVNSSAMSIRRSALDAIGVERFRRMRLAVDSLYLVAALLQGGILVYDPRLLTLFRIHGDQSFVNTALSTPTPEGGAIRRGNS